MQGKKDEIITSAIQEEVCYDYEASDTAQKE